ncbi:unnamed protein product [Vitrella brassicaformis CCMP3155]|uniref:C3H1-type domain-containing protein n=1 Tax=Vitrella brassicaformis (strain CCMP3155) TaxID=1169540 RepID=A0A0G4FXE5_VITBC|nr:unnamed protein product [Vitrella brassicaformis CCMP3155]|eukprot:CEM19535.1 unnamed protein product [Vitrella brassicaformis CCMP3155]
MACSSLLSEADLQRFRTQPCRRNKTRDGCGYGDRRCQFSHNTFWVRRCPFYSSDPKCLRYLPLKCSAVELMEGDSVRNFCKRGGSCPYAHSREEINYHPLYYKTEVCEANQSSECKEYYCPFVHGLAEQRTPEVCKIAGFGPDGNGLPPTVKRANVVFVNKAGDPFPAVESPPSRRRVNLHKPTGQPQDSAPPTPCELPRPAIGTVTANMHPFSHQEGCQSALLLLSCGDQVSVTHTDSRGSKGWMYGTCIKGAHAGHAGWFPCAIVTFDNHSSDEQHQQHHSSGSSSRTHHSGDTPTDTPKASGAVASHTGLQVHHHDSHRAEETWQVGSRYLASRLQMMRPREWPHVLTNGSQ